MYKLNLITLYRFYISNLLPIPNIITHGSISISISRWTSPVFKLSMTRCQIANYLGLTDETVSRIITKFRQESLITANRKSIKILNTKGLQAVADSNHK